MEAHSIGRIHGHLQVAARGKVAAQGEVHSSLGFNFYGPARQSRIDEFGGFDMEHLYSEGSPSMFGSRNERI